MSWPSHAHTAADREHAGREGVALTEVKTLIRDLGDMGCIGCRAQTCPACGLAAEITSQFHVLAARLAAQPVPAPSEEPVTPGHWLDCGCDACCFPAPRLAAQPVPAPSRTEAEVKAEALREAGEASVMDWVPVFYEGESDDWINDKVRSWLRHRADRILRDARPTEDGTS